MIWNGEELNYLQYKKEITLKHDGDFYCLNCLHSFRRKEILNHIKMYVKINVFIILRCLLKKIKL